jgi:hypothetical protein
MLAEAILMHYFLTDRAHVPLDRLVDALPSAAFNMMPSESPLVPFFNNSNNELLWVSSRKFRIIMDSWTTMSSSK